MNKFKVIDVQYVEGYKLKITFADSHCVIVDFEPFLIKNANTICDEYHDLSRFKEFKIEDGNVVWGESWDMIFHPKNLYYNDLFANLE